MDKSITSSHWQSLPYLHHLRFPRVEGLVLMGVFISHRWTF